MKLKRFTVLIVVFSLLLSGCGRPDDPRQDAGFGQDIFSDDMLKNKDTARGDFRRAVWVSYLDIVPMMSPEKVTFENNIDSMLNNLATISVTDIFFQVRAFGDSIYPSAVYPSAAETLYNMSDSFDYLDIVLQKCRARGVRLHAWINPYRLHGSKGAVYQAFVDSLDAQDYYAVVPTDTGRTLNPASGVAQKLVADGVKEILDNYDIDGIHLDDYFYPTTDEAFDTHYYAAYLSGGGTMELAEWRRNNVTTVIKQLFDAVKVKSAGIEFGIAPDASISRNMQQHYLDVELMCRNEGYLDYICPQVYFGYQNTNMPFLSTVTEWSEYTTECDIMVGLSFYKVGTADTNAGSGSGEWLNNSDIISRQYLDTLEITDCLGVAFYRYDSIFNPDSDVMSNAVSEYENLKNVI